MQKKIIALAVAGLVSGGAFAQASNVTIYGLLDANVNWQNSGEGTKMTVGTGGFSASRLGFKGEEAIGNGMSAVWTLEAGLNVDTQSVGNAAVAAGTNTASNTGGSSGTAGQFFSRQGFVGLKGGFGEARLGRQYAGTYIVVATIVDCCSGGGVGDGALLANTGFPTRLNNAFTYATPSFGGFTANITMTSGAENNTGGSTPITSATSDKAGRGWDFVARYDNGPLAAAFTTWSLNNATWTASATVTDLATRKGVSGSASYDFKVVKAHLGIISAKIKGGGYEAANAGAYNSTSGYNLALSAPLGNGRLYFNYASLNDKSIADKDGSAWGVNYGYDLSKRTMLYAGYGKTNNNPNSTYGAADGGGMSNTPVTAGYDPSMFAVGVRHSF